MNNFVYSKEPGILMDALFLLKLYFNGEEAYTEFRNDPEFEENDIAYFEMMKNKLRDIDEQLYPFFYYRANDDMGTPLISYLQTNWNEIVSSDDSILSGFSAFLQDSSRLREFMFHHFFPDNETEANGKLCEHLILTSVLNSAYPNEVKLHLLRFLVSPQDGTKILLDNLNTAVSVCTEIHAQYAGDIQCIFEADPALIDKIYTAHFSDTDQKPLSGYTVCCVLHKTLFRRKHLDSFILFFGITFKDFPAKQESATEFDLYEFTQCMHDKQRIKILSMLRHKEMYCAEIAEELGLKSNSTLHHLLIMHHCNILAVIRRDGKKILYRLNVPYLLKLNNFINTLILESSLHDDKMGNTGN